MPSAFTPGVKIVGVPGPPGPEGPPGEGGGGPHTHPEYEHTHPYAPDPHTHAEFTHTHDYAASDHTHAYAPVVHTHDYAATGHTHTAADVGASPTGHTHDYSPTGHTHDYAATTHNHDGVYAPTHSHPYADASHGIHPDSATWTDLTDGGQTALHSHAGGGASSDTVNVVTASQANSTVTPAVVTEITAASLAAGTYVFKVWVVYQAAATTTGIEMFCNFTGTVSRFASTWYTLTTGGAAATGVADQATTATAQMLEGKGQRVKDVASGPQQGVDTANADQFSVIEGVFIATGSGNFEMKFRSEVAGSAVTIMPGTTLELRKVA